MNPFGNVMMYSNDASLLIPTGALGNEYYAMAWPSWSSLPGFVSIIAVEDGETLLEVTYSAETKEGTEGVESQEKGDVVEYTLEKYEILTLNSVNAPDSDSYGSDLTGYLLPPMKQRLQ